MEAMSRPTARRVLYVLSLLAAGGAVALAAPKAEPAASVRMERLQFIPEDVTIKKGQTVRWTNKDDRDYLIVADDQSWKSENIRPKETFEHTFKTAGTFGYKNILRPRSTGTITVTE